MIRRQVRKGYKLVFQNELSWNTYAHIRLENVERAAVTCLSGKIQEYIFQFLFCYL